MFYSLINALPFGIDITKILLHLLNFVILAVGLTFLLYKPILKFIKKRQEDIKSNIEKGETMQAEAEQKRQEYQEKLDAVDEEVSAIKKAAEADARDLAKEIIDQANADAVNIKEKAKVDAQEIQKQALADAKEQIADAVISLTEELVDREISREDNERIIDNSLKQWKSK